MSKKKITEELPLDLRTRELTRGHWATRETIESPPETMRLRSEAVKLCEALDFTEALKPRLLLLTNVGVDILAPWIPYDTFYTGRILIKLGRWKKAKQKFNLALTIFSLADFPTWVQHCEVELEWLENIPLLKEREAIWLGHARHRKELEWAGYHRWMLSRREVELEAMTVEDFNLHVNRLGPSSVTARN